MASIVKGMLIVNGLIELSFGLSGLIAPESFLHALSFYNTHGTHATRMFYVAIVALGVAALFAYSNVKHYRDTRMGSSALLGCVTYHIGVLYSCLYLIIKNSAELKDPKYARVLDIPGFIEDYTVTPYMFTIQGVGAHSALLFFTLIALACVGDKSEIEYEQEKEAERIERIQNLQRKALDNTNVVAADENAEDVDDVSEVEEKPPQQEQPKKKGGKAKKD